MSEKEDIIKVRFEVTKVRYHNETSGYSIVEAKFLEYNSNYLPTSEIIITGNFNNIFEEDEFEGEGIWKTEKSYGYQFALKSQIRIMPYTEKGIIAFLMKFIKGIGEKTAKKIVERYGSDSIVKIIEDWKNISQINGIGEKKAKRINEKLSFHAKFEEVSLFVLSNGGNYKVALKVYEAFQEGSILKIKENPYCLRSIPKITFLTMDTFAKNTQIKNNDLNRIRESIIEFLENDVKIKGNLYIYKNELLKSFNKFLIKKGAYEKEDTETPITNYEIESCLKQLVIDKRVTIEIDNYGDCIYLERYLLIENKIVEHLKRLTEEMKEPLCLKSQIKDFIINHELETGFKFAQKQKEAIFMALTSGISILTGGPGTGKTQTINSIIKCIKSVKPNATIHLSAPTGKASKRMTELTNMDATTIHRLIGLNGLDKDNELFHIEGDYLIVDESSMVDAYVFYKLLSSVDENMRILFVGDYEQLPSVGAGLILRDLINSLKISTTTLDEIFRQSKESQIVMNSHKLITGKKTTEAGGIEFDDKKGDFFFIEQSDRMKAQRTIIASVKKFIKLGYKMSDIQVLSPMRKGDLGVNDLNRIMQKEFNPNLRGRAEIKINEIYVFRVGDKVIQTINNYTLEVFNGEVGTVVSIYKNEEEEFFMDIDFGDKEITYNVIDAEELQLAYVITIHKSQGSEFPIIIMPIHNSHKGMLNKNLIYTAWTRAKEKVVAIGQKSILDEAIDRSDNTSRNSKIKEKIILSIKNSHLI